MARSRSLALIHVDAQDNPNVGGCSTPPEVRFHDRATPKGWRNDGDCHVGLCVPSCRIVQISRQVPCHAKGCNATMAVSHCDVHARSAYRVSHNFVMPAGICAANIACHAYVMLFQLLIQCSSRDQLHVTEQDSNTLLDSCRTMSGLNPHSRVEATNMIV
ncbi:hypothetical protein HAX54_042577 [Datura stramonium]|uniref:Uncharacterized protein n=1 Tax=Datura stramonium TaxID=4076 RepID=A0ABS8W3G1_DATST|nr:hypothetical protein [Datura stramonium]